MMQEYQHSPGLQLKMTVPGTDGAIDKIVNGLVNLVSLTGASHNFISIDLPLVLDELLRNAVKHGNQNDTQKTVAINLNLVETKLFLEIEDEGSGFILNKQDNSVENKNPYAGNGRGLLMVNGYCEKIEFQNNGSRILVEFDIRGVSES